MTCFWDGILNSLDKEDRSIIGLKTNNVCNLIDKLKAINCSTKNMKWQNKLITENQIKENMIHIETYNKNNASNGYQCSTCDPFLFLLAFIFTLIFDLHCRN